MIVACPFCQYEIQDDQDRCPHCNNPFNKTDWLDVPEAYSTDGLQPRLTLVKVVGGEDKWRPSCDSFIIGRESHGGLDLNSPMVSRQHVQVERIDNVWRVEKLNKDFLLNGELTQSGVLHSGDKLDIGGVILQVEIQYEQFPCSSCQGSLSNPQTIPLNQSKITIGSMSDCDVVIEAPDGFRVMAYKCHGDWWIVDCNSPYGLYVNNKRVRNQKLNFGDRISVAKVGFVFSENGLEPAHGALNDGISIQTVNLGAKSNDFIILEDISFKANPGEFIGVLGPSGCGKSSLIQRIIGLASIKSGDCLINGKSLMECESVFLSQCSYLPQQVALHDSLTVKQEMDCFCDLHASECSRNGIASVLKMVGLESELKKRVGALSGGQQKRLGIALELLRNPQVLILDEPTSGLDPATETEVMQHLQRIAHQGKTVLCSTHQMDNFGLFDKIMILSRGRLVFYGTPNDALTYFERYNVKTPQDIYKLLASGSYAEQKELAGKLAGEFVNSGYALNNPSSETQTELIKKRPNCSPISQFFLQIKGYIKRSFDELFGFINSKHRFMDFFCSAFFIQIILLPLLISQVIKLSCAQKWWSNVSDAGDLFFFCLISVFWLGMNNSIRELVSERTPGRCLERLECVSMSSYIVSKLMWILVLCAVQTAFFSVLTFSFAYQPKITSTPYPVVYWSYQMYLILLGTSLIGAWIALAVSAFFKDSSPAVAMLPIILIPILLFSKPVMNDHDKEKNLSVAITCYNYSPCFAPLDLFKKVNEFNADKRNYERAKENGQENQVKNYEEFMNDSRTAISTSMPGCLKTHAVCFLIAIILTVYFQRKNELEWEGR